MYFASRVQAGRMLAAKIAADYADQKCAVVGLTDGGVMVGAQVAVELHAVLTMLLSAEINIPRENAAIGGITADGVFSFNQEYGSGVVEEFADEYRGLIEQQKLERMHQLNHMLGRGGVIEKSLLRDHVVILVSDGIKSGFEVDLAYQFLKPIAIKKLVIATPLATVPAVDRMHVLADAIYCLSVVGDYMDTNHYYESQDVPDHERVILAIERVVSNWK